MYFILSKVLLFIITPVYWVCTLLLIAAFTKRKKLRRWCAIAGTVLLAILSNGWLLNAAIRSWEYKQVTLPDSSQYSCAIMLGGFGSAQNKRERTFNGSSDRFIQGMKLFYTGHTSHLLMSGGNGTLGNEIYSEADWVKDQLKEFKFADSTILIENRSRNTVENASFSADILKKSGLKPPFLLVTSAIHMRRAAMIFKNNKVDIVPFPCDFQSHDIIAPGFTDFIPDFSIITGWNNLMKEITGYIVNSRMK